MIIRQMTITGIAPLLMQSDRFVDPLNPATKAHKKLTSIRKKTDEDHIAIAKSEWMGALYYREDIGIYVPTINIRKSLIEGARLNKLGKHIERGIVFADEYAKLQYDGPKNPEKLWENRDFVDRRSVVVSRARLIRCRPRFKQWSLTTQIVHEESLINLEDLVMSAENAGALIGLGDYRPMFGRYEVKIDG